MNGRIRLRFHHASIIASDYQKAIRFYVDILGFRVYRQSFSQNKKAKKLELYHNNQYMIELFVKEDSSGAAQAGVLNTGLEHISFLIPDVEQMISYLERRGVRVTDVKRDSITNLKYAFCFDPDGTKIEFYENNR